MLSLMVAKKKESVIKKHQIHEGDTGSPEVQIALLTKRITLLSDHLKKHKKDIHSKRGLLQMVADRRAHLRYLKKKSANRYKKLVDSLGVK